MEAKLITRNLIKPDKNQPRKSFDLDSLIESIKERGVITPLIITPDFQILDGERRWRASKGIQEELPCVIVDQKDYNQPDKRLEIQLIIDEMRENYNVIDRAEAYKRYIDAGHSQKELARLLCHKSDTLVADILRLINAHPSVRAHLKKDDSKWTYHREIEKINGNIPKKQKDRIHKKVIEGTFKDRDELIETLQFAKTHPVERERIIEAKDSSERGLVMLQAEPVEKKAFRPKRKEMSQTDIDQERFTQMIQALNTINSSRILWAMTDATDLVKRLATKEQIETIIKSIETIIRVWTKTLKELKK